MDLIQVFLLAKKTEFDNNIVARDNLMYFCISRDNNFIARDKLISFIARDKNIIAQYNFVYCQQR